jgi:hypothetical protein
MKRITKKSSHSSELGKENNFKFSQCQNKAEWILKPRVILHYKRKMLYFFFTIIKKMRSSYHSILDSLVSKFLLEAGCLPGMVNAIHLCVGSINS